MGLVVLHMVRRLFTIIIEIIDAMIHVKSLLIIPLFFVCSMKTFAFNRDSVITVILDLLDKKHCYEISLNPNVKKYSSESKPFKDVVLIDKSKCKNTIIASSNYENAISGIKSNKSILLFIEEELNKGNNSLLNKKYILYNYEEFNVFKSNKMTYFDFLRIIRHSFFELNMSDLPSLKDAVEYLNKS